MNVAGTGAAAFGLILLLGLYFLPARADEAGHKSMTCPAVLARVPAVRPSPQGGLMATSPEAFLGKSFWEQLDALAASRAVVVDRPKWTAHPRFPSFVYPLDYGYFPGTAGGDGEGIDAFIGEGSPRVVTAIAATFDPFAWNAEIKVLLGCSPRDIQLVEEFYLPQPQSAIVIRRPR